MSQLACGGYRETIGRKCSGWRTGGGGIRPWRAALRKPLTDVMASNPVPKHQLCCLRK
jgi:hypothetical protein